MGDERATSERRSEAIESKLMEVQLERVEVDRCEDFLAGIVNVSTDLQISSGHK